MFPTKIFFFQNRAVNEIMWENIVQPVRPKMKIWHVLIASPITKVTNTHSGYVIVNVNVTAPSTATLTARKRLNVTF